MDEKALLDAIGKMMDTKLEQQLQPIQQELAVLKTDVATLKRNVFDMKENIDEVRDSQNYLIGWVERISQHVNIK